MEIFRYSFGYPWFGGGGGRAGQKVDIVHQLFSNGDCFMRQTDRQTNMGNRGVASSTTRFVCFFRDNYITWPRTHICSYRVLRISNACYFQTESVVAWNCNCTQMQNLRSRGSSVTVVTNARAKLPCRGREYSCLQRLLSSSDHSYCLWNLRYFLSSVPPEFNVWSSVSTLHSSS